MNIYNTHNPHRKQSSVQRTASAANSMGMGLAAGLLPFTSEMALFEFPFNELLVRDLFLL
jgi:transient receptor potential cation channel subfamily M member 3